MNIHILSKQLGIEVNELLIKCSKINLKYDVGVENFLDLTRTEYDILRSLLDPNYMVKLFKGSKNGAKYNYSDSIFYEDISNWITKQNLENCSTKDIKNLIPGHLNSIGVQALAAAMKLNGYFNEVVSLGDGKQGRRWRKRVSFI